MANRQPFEIPIPVAGFTWILKGHTDKSSQEIDATLSVMVPIMGVFQLTKVRGSLKDGVRVSFDKHNLHGEARFYILEEWLYWHLSKTTVFGITLGPLDTKLMPLPQLDALLGLEGERRDRRRSYSNNKEANRSTRWELEAVVTGRAQEGRIAQGLGGNGGMGSTVHNPEKGQRHFQLKIVVVVLLAHRGDMLGVMARARW
ncbi:hypothetical protein BJV78DRAFT_1355663 [Lactifluus subvellereus]|nr:hypothetical protein BJV78DRAFT_1355663 [Lactifluus subvellereus]